MPKPRRARLAIVLSAAAYCALGTGCNIVGPLVYFARGPDKIKRLHTLDKAKTSVVVIDDRANRIPRRASRILIGEAAEQTLLKNRVVKDMVSFQSALAAAGSDKDGKPLSIAEVGQAVGAEVVIYATVDEFTISPDGASVAPMASMRVRVVDVKADARTWPPDPMGHRLVTRISPRTASMPSGTTALYQLEDDLARRAGLDLAQIFYDHVPTPVSRVTE